MARKKAGVGRKPPSPAASVGYQRPPEHTQFKPGQSGNPAGRPRGSRNFKTEMREALAAEVEVVIDGQPQRLSKFRVVFEKLMAAASKGDFKATELTIKIGQWLDDHTDYVANDDIDLTQDDRTILDRYVTKRGLPKS